MTTVVRTRVLHRPFPDLDRPARVFGHIPPNWFAAVMGTGIVAVAATSLPYQPTGLHTAAIAVWALAALLLVVVSSATVVHAVRYPEVFRSHFTHPVTAHFAGAIPMALLTAGAGTLLIGRDVIGTGAAVAVDVTLWLVGTVGGLLTAVVVPHRLRAAGHLRPEQASGGWLMPVVPPMVSAWTGALLVPHAPAGDVRSTLLVCCYAMFAGAAIASAVVVARIWRKLVVHGIGAAATVPTLWIVLGPLGQSVTAANLLGGVAHEALPPGVAHVLQVAGLVYGVPVWSVAVVWAAFAAVVTMRSAPPFALTWWSFTFPVGTVVTGTSGLALHTGSSALAVLAVVFYAGLVAAWSVVATCTARAAVRGWVFLPPDRLTGRACDR